MPGKHTTNSSGGQDSVTPPLGQGTNVEAEKAASELRPTKLALAASDGIPVPREVGDKGPTHVQELEALLALRRVAKPRGWTVASPTRLLAKNFRRYTKPDDGERRNLHLAVQGNVVSFGTFNLTDDERDLLLPHVKVLEALDGMYDFGGILPPFPRQGTVETGRWDLHGPEDNLVGYVSRIEESGQPKRYIAHFARFAGKDQDKRQWHAAPFPPCDLQPFWFDDAEDSLADIMLVEGPKAMDAAHKVRRATTELGLAIRRHSIWSWHGAADGVLHTDWSKAAGRIVRCMVDTDAPGLDNMLAAARAISDAGGRPAILRLGKLTLRGGKDFADKPYVKYFGEWSTKAAPLFRAAVAPFYPRIKGKDDKLLPIKMRENFRDTWIWVPAAKAFFSEITQEEYDYDTFSAVFPSRAAMSTAKMLMADERRRQAIGVSYLPGSSFGLQESGTFNIAVPSPLRTLTPADKPDLPEDVERYLAGCIPDPIARKGVLDFTAHAIAYPDERPGWAVLMVGSAKAGKTTLARFLGSLAGRMVEKPVEAILGEFQSPEIMYAASLFVEELYDYAGRGDERAVRLPLHQRPSGPDRAGVVRSLRERGAIHVPDAARPVLLPASAVMQPGAVAIWPDRSMGLMEVSPIERLTWGENVLTIVLTGRRRIVVRCHPQALSVLEQHQHEMRFIKFLQPPPMVLG